MHNLLESPALGFRPTTMWTGWPGNPLRSADWRWQQALRSVDSKRHPREHYDDGVRQAQKLLRALGRCDSPESVSRFWSRHADFRAALDLWLARGWPRSLLEAWILCGAPTSQISARTGFSEETIEFYQRYFFDVAGRSRGFIAHNVIAVHRESLSGAPFVREAMKRLAFGHGPLALERLLQADVEHIERLSIADIERSLDQPDDRLLAVRACLAAMTVPVDTEEEKLEFLAFYARNVSRLQPSVGKPERRLELDVQLPAAGIELSPIAVRSA